MRFLAPRARTSTHKGDMPGRDRVRTPAIDRRKQNTVRPFLPQVER